MLFRVYGAGRSPDSPVPPGCRRAPDGSTVRARTRGGSARAVLVDARPRARRHPAARARQLASHAGASRTRRDARLRLAHLRARLRRRLLSARRSSLQVEGLLLDMRYFGL